MSEQNQAKNKSTTRTKPLRLKKHAKGKKSSQLRQKKNKSLDMGEQQYESQQVRNAKNVLLMESQRNQLQSQGRYGGNNYATQHIYANQAIDNWQSQKIEYHQCYQAPKQIQQSSEKIPKTTPSNTPNPKTTNKNKQEHYNKNIPQKQPNPNNTHNKVNSNLPKNTNITNGTNDLSKNPINIIKNSVDHGIRDGKSNKIIEQGNRIKTQPSRLIKSSNISRFQKFYNGRIVKVIEKSNQPGCLDLSSKQIIFQPKHTKDRVIPLHNLQLRITNHHQLFNQSNVKRYSSSTYNSNINSTTNMNIKNKHTNTNPNINTNKNTSANTNVNNTNINFSIGTKSRATSQYNNANVKTKTNGMTKTQYKNYTTSYVSLSTSKKTHDYEHNQPQKKYIKNLNQLIYIKNNDEVTTNLPNKINSNKKTRLKQEINPRTFCIKQMVNSYINDKELEASYQSQQVPRRQYSGDGDRNVTNIYDVNYCYQQYSNHKIKEILHKNNNKKKKHGQIDKWQQKPTKVQQNKDTKRSKSKTQHCCQEEKKPTYINPYMIKILEIQSKYKQRLELERMSIKNIRIS